MDTARALVSQAQEDQPTLGAELDVVTTGLEVLLADPRQILGRGKVGLVANPTTVDATLHHAAELFFLHPDIDLRLLFGPEHGLWGQAQDMEGVTEAREPVTGLPVVSLYGHTEASLAPTAAQLEPIDLLVFDVQDIGSRYYTYAATMALCLRACAAAGKPFVVLDRPNPIGGTQSEGGGLQSDCASFVGLYPIPQRHGLTVGELARLYRDAFGLGGELTVVPCRDWQREQYFDQTGLPWVMPSPNMPTLDTALVYPGMCLLEATNLSEGRGTTRPFELCGAPYVDGRRLAETMSQYDLPGVRFRPCFVQPTFHKHAGLSCGAVQLHVTDRRVFLPYRTGLALLHAARTLWPAAFAWRQEPYEFRADVPAIDLLTGEPAVREALDRGAPFDELLGLALSSTSVFAVGRSAALLY